MRVNRQASLNAIMRKEGVSRQEAEELLQSLLDAGMVFEDDASGVAEENEKWRDEYGDAYAITEDEQLVNDLVDNEMTKDLALHEQDPVAYRGAVARKKSILARIRKRALDPSVVPPAGGMTGTNPGIHNPGMGMGSIACPSCGNNRVEPSNQNDPDMPAMMQCDQCGYAWQEAPQMVARKQALDQIEHDRDLYETSDLESHDMDIKTEAYNIMLSQFPDSDPEVINAAINEAWTITEKEGLRKDAKEIVRVAQFYAGVGDAQHLARFAYILARNSQGALDCPLCHSKVARKKDNPMHFYCPNGHVSKISIRKSAAPSDILSEEDLGTDDNPIEDESGRSPYPPDHEAEPEPEQPNALSLSQDERNRLNGVLYQVQEQASTPFMIAGVLDGFFDSDTFAEICQSQEDLSEYQFGRREGKQSKGGDFTPGVN